MWLIFYCYTVLVKEYVTMSITQPVLKIMELLGDKNKNYTLVLVFTSCKKSLRESQ